MRRHEIPQDQWVRIETLLPGRAGGHGGVAKDNRGFINYTAVIKKLVASGYTDYVGQEFNPTRDPLEGLKEAVRVCDV
jgi:hydroxypyruvate isomerase